MATCENQGCECHRTEFTQLDSGSTLFDSVSLRNLEKLSFPQWDKKLLPKFA